MNPFERREGTTLVERTLHYEERDVMLYALSIGATELPLVCELADLAVLPTFATVSMARVIPQALTVLGVDLDATVHVEQSLVVHAPLPRAGAFLTTATLGAAFDQTTAALLRLDTTLRASRDGRLLAAGATTLLCRGHGGFGGPLPMERQHVSFPAVPPKFHVRHGTGREQALLFRLNGDRNPVHALPDAAVKAGWSRPILHGLFTYGALGLAFVRHACGGNPAGLRRLSGRFSGVLHPGDTLVLEGWDVDPGAGAGASEWIGVARAAETGRPLLSHVQASCDGPHRLARTGRAPTEG